jgi:hypothetical protein
MNAYAFDEQRLPPDSVTQHMENDGTPYFNTMPQYREDALRVAGRG